jgi:hypothetical protein
MGWQFNSHPLIKIAASARQQSNESGFCKLFGLLCRLSQSVAALPLQFSAGRYLIHIKIE